MFSKSFVRNRTWEDEQLAFLRKLGLKYKNGLWNPDEDPEKPETENYYRPVNWLTYNRDELETQGYKILQNKLNTKYFTGNQILDIQVKSNDDWFDIYAMVKFGDFQIPFIRLRKHILNNIREFELPSGEIAILPLEWFSTVQRNFSLCQNRRPPYQAKEASFFAYSG